MGNQSSAEEPIQLEKYLEGGEYTLAWAGRLTLLTSGPQILLRKTICLNHGDDATMFISRFWEQKKSAFYLLRPVMVALSNQDSFCSIKSTIYVYHHDLLPTLQDKLLTPRSNLRSETKIWFLLNQIAHSLGALFDKAQPHLWIAPNTIFSNSNENWFLQDMAYWHGLETESLLLSKSKDPKQTMSRRMREMVRKRLMIDCSMCFDEDVYCLGHVILSLLAGDNSGRLQIEDIQEKYSDKLMSLVNEMIEENPTKRISFERLRIKMKLDESHILNQEIKESYHRNQPAYKAFSTIQKLQQNPVKPMTVSPLPTISQIFPDPKAHLMSYPPFQGKRSFQKTTSRTKRQPMPRKSILEFKIERQEKKRK